MGKSFGTWYSKMSFPYLDDTVFIDIETDLQMKHVWLIGVKIGSIEKQFLAENFSEEGRILVEFAEFLNNYPSKPLVCYSTTNFDFRVLRNAAHRLSLQDLIDQFSNRALIDMGTLLRRHFRPLGGSYSLKLLRFLIGYKYDDISVSGEDVAIQYYREVRRFGKISQSFAEKALKYNLDDIRILHYMIEKFADHIEFTSTFTSDVQLSSITEILERELYSSRLSQQYLRVSVPNEKSSHIMGILMSCGLPLPEVKEGVNITALYWRSSFSYNQALSLVESLNFEFDR